MWQLNRQKEQKAKEMQCENGLDVAAGVCGFPFPFAEAAK